MALTQVVLEWKPDLPQRLVESNATEAEGGCSPRPWIKDMSSNEERATLMQHLWPAALKARSRRMTSLAKYSAICEINHDYQNESTQGVSTAQRNLFFLLWLFSFNGSIQTRPQLTIKPQNALWYASPHSHFGWPSASVVLRHAQFSLPATGSGSSCQQCVISQQPTIVQRTKASHLAILRAESGRKPMNPRNHLAMVIVIINQHVQWFAHDVVPGVMRRRFPDGLCHALGGKHHDGGELKEYLHAGRESATGLATPVDDISGALAAEVVQETARAGVALGRIRLEAPWL